MLLSSSTFALTASEAPFKAFSSLLLEEFVDGIDWIHLDIAGPGRSRSSSSIYPEGGTGFGVLGYFNFLLEQSKN